MKSLNEHLCKILADKLIKRRLVTWYDPHRDFEPFVKELRGNALASECRLEEVRLSGQKVPRSVEFRDGPVRDDAGKVRRATLLASPPLP